MTPDLFLILDGTEVIDGVTKSRDEVLRAIPFLSRGVEILRITKGEMVRDVSEDFVREAYDAGEIDREHALVSEHLTLPETWDEHQSNRADIAYHEVA